MRSLGMFSARRADIADRSYSWQNPNDSARILNVGEVRIMLMKEFNGHELLFRDSPDYSVGARRLYLALAGEQGSRRCLGPVAGAVKGIAVAPYTVVPGVSY